MQHNANKHALARAIEKERERCAGIADEIGSGTYGPEESTAYWIAEKIRGNQ